MSSILIDIARRRQRPGSGSILEITKSCGTNMFHQHPDDHDPVLGLKWLVLLKLKAGRVQDLADISRMMGCASQQDIEATKTVVNRWLEDASEDLASLIHLGQMENQQS